MEIFTRFALSINFFFFNAPRTKFFLKFIDCSLRKRNNILCSYRKIFRIVVCVAFHPKISFLLRNISIFFFFFFPHFYQIEESNSTRARSIFAIFLERKDEISEKFADFFKEFTRLDADRARYF